MRRVAIVTLGPACGEFFLHGGGELCNMPDRRHPMLRAKSQHDHENHEHECEAFINLQDLSTDAVAPISSSVARRQVFNGPSAEDFTAAADAMPELSDDALGCRLA